MAFDCQHAAVLAIEVFSGKNGLTRNGQQSRNWEKTMLFNS